MGILAEINTNSTGEVSVRGRIESIDDFMAKFRPTEREADLMLDYPGPRPEGSFITDGENLLALPDDYDEFHSVTNALLRQANLPLLEERIPVFAYGANASPHKLNNKMATFGSDAQNLMQTVPHISATMPGAIAVWHGRPGQVGSVFAELYPAQEEGAALQAHAAFLTPEQLAAIHITEGVTYSAAELSATVQGGENDRQIQVVAYVALQASVLLQDSRPILVKDLRNTGSSLSQMSAEEAVSYMLDAAKDDIGDITVEDFVAEGKGLKLAAKKARQERVRLSLARQGRSKEYAYPLEEGALIGRADLSSLPGRLHDNRVLMPEMVLASIRPTREIIDRLAVDDLDNPASKSETLNQARRKVQDKIDPARRLAERAHDELEVRLELDSQNV